MTGVWHSVAAIALSTISVTPAATVAASVGADGVPATRLSFIHQYTVWAPRARSSPALTVPEVAATTPGRPKTSFRNDTEPSAYSTHRGRTSGRPQSPPGAAGDAWPRPRAAPSAMTTTAIFVTARKGS